MRIHAMNNAMMKLATSSTPTITFFMPFNAHGAE